MILNKSKIKKKKCDDQLFIYYTLGKKKAQIKYKIFEVLQMKIFMYGYKLQINEALNQK